MGRGLKCRGPRLCIGMQGCEGFELLGVTHMNRFQGVELGVVGGIVGSVVLGQRAALAV